MVEQAEQVGNKEGEGEQAAAAGQEEMVPKSRLEEETAKVKAAEEQNALYRDNQDLIRANAASAANAPKVEPFDIFKEVGLNPNDPDEFPSQAQIKKIQAYNRQQDNLQTSLILTRLDHTDFNEIVGTTEQIRSGLYAAPLAAAIKADPALRTQIMNSANPYATAYTIAKLHRKKTETGGETTGKTEAQRAIDEAVENANRVKTGANAKGGDGLSEAGRVEALSEAEFIKEFNKFGGDL